jgi:hypothetical protein
MATRTMPTHEIRFGAIRATIWTNRSTSGEQWYCVTVSRFYKDSHDKWQETHSFKMQHLPDVAQAVEAAGRWIEQHSMTPQATGLVRSLVEGALSASGKTTRRSS